MNAIDGAARIETVPGGDGVEVTVTGAEEWTGTGTPDEQDGLIVVTGTAAPTADPSAETDLTLVIDPEGCT